ncbi:hypothetical protein A3C24_02995 [Candidatus Roizmanbacteria bacterium RIFCSPHIGHO2_02_FULL_37_24]|uniref:Uncharacterized protein n=1 Tax=Candidatus Roizmanbacteria bacterium RIFCSPHIGHO2_02_FULL_37_24 TaxID=1802037 RepID=A0A1F7GY81_9BACT|nr:MAG: hypothetical protein A3C24_02995 [Candidatus Roizmanbacteria bacterium RIFCSPHIGHO2_02_FULL_37_24]OGK32356.1 MAG: hypothetical protein A3E10_04195 [Candidatus Roizmanbacteria bacterium RIFCSPHIGHO2_12_FULL_37_23]OGK44696.1 MAG: hypothetical protein A2956_01025 [Candidatus Roizmanbacteria bacterium RIFCSPLOWO2_01_FULL_37_57]OGK61392.1 MAG: hypothetical protein A3G65_01600 [Candidatus Roizmanbacteria bacterium RIFCSPLOWO2_12_FULL_37_7b]HJZ24441.1 DUF5676 family membrane protein [Candidatu
MYKPKAKAHAVAVVAAGLYIICAIWSMFATNSFMTIFSYWIHSVDLTALPPRTPDIGSVIIGLITFTGAAWLTGYAFAVAYNYFEKKK